MTIPFVDLVAQYRSIQEEVDQAIRGVVEGARFIGGREVEAFEREFGRFQGAPHCIGVANGTDAIEIVLEGLDLPPDSEVVVPANSFIASSEAVTRAGFSVVFADVDPVTYTIDPRDVEARVTERTRAILAVHLYGQPADLGSLNAVAGRHDLHLIEDAAQAHGAEYEGHRVGTLGTAGTFSFYPGKNLGAYGDAGAIVAADAELMDRMRRLANHGRSAKYDHDFEGRNSRLDALQAAVLRVKLRHLERWTEHRRLLAERYRQGLRGVGDLTLPEEAPYARHVYHLFVVRTRRRDALRERLSEVGVATGIHYPVALPRLKAYAEHAQHAEPLRAVEMAPELLSLPMADSIGEAQVDQVVEAVRAFFRA